MIDLVGQVAGRRRLRTFHALVLGAAGEIHSAYTERALVGTWVGGLLSVNGEEWHEPRFECRPGDRAELRFALGQALRTSERGYRLKPLSGDRLALYDLGGDEHVASTERRGDEHLWKMHTSSSLLARYSRELVVCHPVFDVWPEEPFAIWPGPRNRLSNLAEQVVL